MRNLKRALSLGLTAAMISGLMVMGSSAASYADVTSENNVEAIEVLEAVGIMIGDENGNFNPDQNVTRNEMAVVMANLMEYNVASYKDTSPFTDVPSWAEPYVAACWTNGITAGYSDTIYGGSDTVTTAQAALMLMKALGYFQYASDFGSDWQLATTRQGNAIDLFVGVDSGVTQPMTRNDVAQLVLNTLEAGTVEASTDGSWSIGDVVINNNVTYSYITSNQTYATAIDDARSTSNNSDAQRSIVELGEQLYMGDLKLDDNETDVFGRPARYWEYDSKEIGTYAKTELLKQSYTTEVTGKDLYDLLGNNVVDNYTFNVAIDGVTDHNINDAIFNETSINRNNKAGVGETGNGVLTEVYVDSDNKQVDIAIINTYLAIADSDYNEKRDELSLDVYAVDKTGDEYVKTLTKGSDDMENMAVSGEDFDVAKAVKDDVYMVTIAGGEIQTLAKPETLSAVEITSFKQGDNLTADGTKYEYSTVVEYDKDTLEAYTDGSTINLKDMTYNVYLDQYGYVLGVVEVEKPNNYLFITGINGNYDNLANVTYEANAIFLDGTMGKITIDAKKSDFGKILTGTEQDATVNRWFTYSVNSKDVYSVELVDINAGVNELGQSHDPDRHDANGDTIVIDYKNDSAYDKDGSYPNTGANKIYGNDETVYLTASVSEIKASADTSAIVIDDVDSVAVGIDNVDIQPWDETEVRNEEDGAVRGAATYVSSGIYSLYDEDGYIIAMVVVGEDNGNNDSLVYVHSDSLTEESYNKTTEEWTWTRTVIMDGEEATLTEVDDSRISMLNKMDENKWYRVRFNADNEVVSVRSDNIDDNGNGKNDDGRIDQDVDFEKFWDLYTPTPASDVNLPYAYVQNHAGGAINTAINTVGVDTVLYHQLFKGSSSLALSNSGKTLYLTQDHDSYIRFTDNTKVVFEQMNKNKWDTEFWSGQSGVEKAIKELRADNGSYNYTVSALIDDGRASTIIIRDNTKSGDSGTAPVNDNYRLVLSGDTYTLEYRTGSYTGTTEQINTVLDMILADLTDKGYGDFEIRSSGDRYTISAVNGRVTREFKWDSKPSNNTVCVLVTVDGKNYMVVDNTDVTDLPGFTGNYAKVTFENGDVRYATRGWGVADNYGWDGAEIETGYYKVTLSSSYAIKEDSDTADDGILYMKSNDTVRVKITSADDWNDWAPTFDKGFTFDEVDFGYDGSTTGYSEVDLTAPTLTNDVTVTVGSTART